MASIKIKGSLESADLLGFPMNINISRSFSGVGAAKSFQKVTTVVRANPATPAALNGKAFTSADKRAYVYLKNNSITATELVNVYIKYTTVLTAAELNAKGCCTGCEEGALEVDRFIRISSIQAGEYLFIPVADQDYLYIDSAAGTPSVDFLVLEE
jgi:hypothetical protein